MRSVSIVGSAQLPVKKQYQEGLRQLGGRVARQALWAAGADSAQALYLSNMLADELQDQKQLAALVADEAGLHGIEALQIRAAMASGAGALRVGYLAVAAGLVDSALVVGVEIMSSGVATPALAKALDAEVEVPDGATMLSQNARLMHDYRRRYRPPDDALAHFSVNAHANAKHNPNALFRDREYTPSDVMNSRLISPPLRLLDCSPICDGAAAVLLVPTEAAGHYAQKPVHVLASSAATDRFRLADRSDPLHLAGVRRSSEQVYKLAGVGADDIDLFEVHDAFSIMACLSLEAAGFALPGEGWQLAAQGAIGRSGRIPVATMGGLKARGHPIGATALYQACEIVQQLSGNAGLNQIPEARIALMQSVGGIASTVISHILAI
ncbi:MAG: hypothetical protein R3300_16385 [Candidatus Promineifilaceae bacterium]|nr:hypothetical protein [Candidatus Promineifilaceae bacterium]